LKNHRVLSKDKQRKAADMKTKRFNGVRILSASTIAKAYTVSALALAFCMQVRAAVWEADGQTAANYQSATGTWETASIWSTNGTLLSTWPGLTIDDARIGFSQQNQSFLLTIDSSVTVNSLNIAAQNGTKATITNGTLHIGAGGLTVAGNQAAVDSEVIWSSIVLDANQTWNTVQNLWVRGDISGSATLTKIGASPLNLYSGNNTFSGGFTCSSIVLNTFAGTGSPVGTGSIGLIGNGAATSTAMTQLKLVPSATGATTLTGGTETGSQFSFTNTAFLYLARKDASSPLTYTFGPGSGTVMNRLGKGVLVIQDNTSVLPSNLGISGGNNFIISGTAPAINNGMVDAYYLGGRSGGQGESTFLTYDNTFGFKPATFDVTTSGTITPTGWDNTKKVFLNNTATLSTDAAVYALRLNGGSGLNNNAILSIGDGTQTAGLILNVGIFGNGTINFGSSEGLFYVGNSPVVSNTVAGSGGLTKAQYDGTNGKLILAANPTYTGVTTVNNGILEFTGSAVSLGTVQGVGTLQYAGVGTMSQLQASGTLFAGTLANAGSGTMNLTLAGSNMLTTVQNTSSGTLNVNSALGTNNITTLTSSGAGGKMTFSGAGSVNNVAGSFQGNNAASTNIFTGGSWYLLGPGNSGGNRVGTLIVDGAFVSFAGGRYVSSAGGTLNVNSGQLQFLGDRFNPGGDYTGSIQINISGGLLDVAQSQYGFSLGASGGNHAINQTGGILQYGFSLGNSAGTGNFIIGADTGKMGTNTVSLAGGTVWSRFTISGRQPQTTSIEQQFNWTGGVLAVVGIEMLKLGSYDGTTTFTSNVLLNAGGILAPGNLGIPGKTTVTGSYTESSANAMLAFDLGGATQANAFTNGPAYYDYLNVNNGAATVAGRLEVRLINGYTPPANKGFIVLENTGTGAGLSGSFANVSGGKVWCSDGYSQFDVLFNAPANKVILTNYAGNAWSPTSGSAWTTSGNWTLAEPNGSDMAAYFGLGGSGNVSLTTARTVRSLIFNNNSSYSLAGTGGALTLQGDALTAPQMTVLAGSHEISVPIALSNATQIAVAASSQLTLSGNVTGAQNVTKTGTGTLVFGGVNTLLGALTVSAGTVKQAGGTVTLSALALLDGSTYDLWVGVLRIAEGAAGGAIDTVAEVEAAITAGTIQGRGKVLPTSEFKIAVVDGYVKVELKAHGTVISFQ
jgi:autotransporter-associated beta strand protein